LTEGKEIDPVTHSLTLLGTFPGNSDDDRLPAILRVENTTLDPNSARDLISWVVEAKIIESTDIVRGHLTYFMWF
jgi:hypothetical protein